MCICSYVFYCEVLACLSVCVFVSLSMCEGCITVCMWMCICVCVCVCVCVCICVYGRTVLVV